MAKIPLVIIASAVMSMSMISTNVSARVTAGMGAGAAEQCTFKKNIQDEILARMSIIKMAEDSTEPMLLKEADVAKAELERYQKERTMREEMGISDTQPIMPSNQEVLEHAGMVLLAISMVIGLLLGFMVGRITRT